MHADIGKTNLNPSDHPPSLPRTVPTLPSRYPLARILFLAISVTACKGATEVCTPGDPLCDPSDAVPTSVTVSPSSATLSVGETRQLMSTVRDQNGQPILGASVTWSSEETGIASVSSSGLVTAEGPGSTTINAESGSVGGSATITVGDPCDPVGTIGYGESGLGSLTATDCVFETDFFVDWWTLSLSVGGDLQIDLASLEFDAVVGLFDGSGNFLDENDDNGVDTGTSYDQNSRLFANLSAGSYQIGVSSFSAGGVGAYSLSVGPGLPCPEIGSASIGTDTFGSLSVDDCSYGSTDTFYADPYVVEVKQDATVTFTLTSVDFDAFLTLYDPSGNVLDTDDDNDNNVGVTANPLDARISISLKAGWYVIEASSALGSELGDYTLTVE